MRFCTFFMNLNKIANKKKGKLIEASMMRAYKNAHLSMEIV